jgi:hypothetical protein
VHSSAHFPANHCDRALKQRISLQLLIRGYRCHPLQILRVHHGSAAAGLSGVTFRRAVRKTKGHLHPRRMKTMDANQKSANNRSPKRRVGTSKRARR